jgi:hypothetical protein
MTRPFIGSEALRSGEVTRHGLRSRFIKLHPDVYVAPDVNLTADGRAYAAWLWSKRRGVVAGESASALHGAKWVAPQTPAQLLYEHRRPPAGIITWSDQLAPNETQLVAGIRITTPARTAFDLASRYPLGKAIAVIDALARATQLRTADVEPLLERHKGHRNIRQARKSLSLVDHGAQSPRETWLRLLVIEAGYPPPQTQIPIRGSYGELVGVVDMGWEQLKLALEYEGEHHRTPRQFANDIARYETMTNDLHWIVIRVTSQDTPGGILGRLAAAWSRRTCDEGGKIA